AWKAADALSRAVEPDLRGTIWLRFAERVHGTMEERRALERAGIEGGKAQAIALDRLISLYEAADDRPLLADALRRRVAIEPKDDAKSDLAFRLGTLLESMIRTSDQADRASIVKEAEEQLL